MITALGARVHLFVRPAYRERFVALFRDVLGCQVRELDFGLAHPILFVGFADKSGFSVEFTDDAAIESPGDTLDDTRSSRGAWIEFRTDDLAGTQQKLRDAGIREFRHPGSAHFYYCAPGGQIFRLLDVAYEGP